MKIALDAMGGDFGPPSLVGGAVMALREYQHINKLFLVGDSAKIETELKKHRCNDSRIDIVHSSQVVEMSDRAVEAVRRKKDSSVSRAVDLVKNGEADAIVSAGHTGAAVAATTIKLRTLPGIDRPGIAAVLPTQFNVFVLIDAGANTDARPEHLLQYAIMGSVYSRHVLGYKSPRVGLISLGEEDVKGTEKTKEVFVGPWFRTGDKYYQDGDGYFWHAGRADDLFKVNGRWLSPAEVESALIAHPAVREAAVVARDDEAGLTKPAAYVVVNAEFTPKDQLARDLQDWVAQRVGGYKRPRWVEFLPEIPKTATGKLQRFKLRELQGQRAESRREHS